MFLAGALQQDEKCSSKCDVTMMDRWHIPGSSRAESLSTLINKLNERFAHYLLHMFSFYKTFRVFFSLFNLK